MDDFNDLDYWKGIVLYGLNSATYKIALGKALVELSKQNKEHIRWDTLSEEFLNQYLARLSGENPFPQQAIPMRQTVMERVVKQIQLGTITKDKALSIVAQDGLSNVIPRFQSIAGDKKIVENKFYHFDFGKELVLHDSVFSIIENNENEIIEELDARWGLLEGAFSIHQEHWDLSNDIRDIYIKNGHQRTNITKNIPFLQGYQGNTCFYCGEGLNGDIHVDHVLPRQVVQHDEIWNLVLSHSHCNMSKLDKLVGKHYMEKLIQRNENIMGSNHPWKKKIQEALGSTPKQRASKLWYHYQNVKSVLGAYYWGGIEGYNPASDPFYIRLITKLNNR